jgi:hypothetical protein
VDTSSANIVPTEDSSGKDCAASVSKVAVETEVGPESRLLPEMLGEELWRTAGAESVEVSKAEFSQALETIGARDNFGLEPGKQASERQRETFWRGSASGGACDCARMCAGAGVRMEVLSCAISGEADSSCCGDDTISGLG